MSMELQDVLNKVEKAYGGLGQSARLVLAAAATTRLNSQHPLAIILVGGPSSGKTSILLPLTRGHSGSALKQTIIRVDDFTTASFLSHSANKKTEELEKIDLLPKLNGKCAVIKEMAPVFTGRDDELTRKLSVLASVLDGEGFVSSSGNHGQRGYTDRIVFTMVGAITPAALTGRVFDSMGAIGPRFNFWQMPEREIDLATWEGPGPERALEEEEASGALMGMLEELFSEVPARSIDRRSFEIGAGGRKLLSLCAVLMASVRSTMVVAGPKSDDKAIAQKESPERAYRYVEQIAMGSAILERRTRLQHEDLSLALRLAAGGARPRLSVILRAFMEKPGTSTVSELAGRVRLDPETVQRRLADLLLLGVVGRANDCGTAEWDLRPEFRPLKLYWPPTPPEDVSHS